jgi:hypothetical protein
MLDARAADKRSVIHRLLVLIAFACCTLVLASFTMFARDQIAGASKHQQNELISGTPATVEAIPVHHAHAQPRRFIDSAFSSLTSPFRSLVASDSSWAQHGLLTLLALLVYGVGIGYLARFSRGMS